MFDLNDRLTYSLTKKLPTGQGLVYKMQIMSEKAHDHHREKKQAPDDQLGGFPGVVPRF
jgi:hypothetical protein